MATTPRSCFETLTRCKASGSTLIKPFSREPVYGQHTVEQTGNIDHRGRRLLGQMAQSTSHHSRVASLLFGQHGQQAELGGTPGPDELLQTWGGSWHDQRPLVERQNLAEGVVAAHGDHPGGTSHQGLEPRIKGDRADFAKP